MIRPKSEETEIELDQENDQNVANYHDERGCPAAAPWMNEKRTKIEVDEKQLGLDFLKSSIFSKTVVDSSDLIFET